MFSGLNIRKFVRFRIIATNPWFYHTGFKTNFTFTSAVCLSLHEVTALHWNINRVIIHYLWTHLEWKVDTGLNYRRHFGKSTWIVEGTPTFSQVINRLGHLGLMSCFITLEEAYQLQQGGPVGILCCCGPLLQETLYIPAKCISLLILRWMSLKASAENVFSIQGSQTGSSKLLEHLGQHVHHMRCLHCGQLQTLYSSQFWSSCICGEPIQFLQMLYICWKLTCHVLNITKKFEHTFVYCYAAYNKAENALLY